MQKIIKQRIKIVIAALSIVFPCIFMRLFYIQIVLHSHYSSIASKNLDRYKSLPPRRGAMYDRNNFLLTKTSPAYDILVIIDKVLTKEKIKIKTGYTIKREFDYESINNLAQLLGVHSKEIMIKIAKIYKKKVKQVKRKMVKHEKFRKKKPRKYRRKQREYEHDYFNRKEVLYKKIPYEAALRIKIGNSHIEMLNAADKDIVSSKYKRKPKQKFKGFKIQTRVSRKYPWNDLASHILGQISSIRDVRKYPKSKDYRSDDMIGTFGLEKIYEEELRGKRGCIVDSREGKGIYNEKPTDGMDLILTLDVKAQKLAETLLDQMVEKNQKILDNYNQGNKRKQYASGAAVVIDVHTGDIVVMASSPRYNNNTFAKDYAQLLKDPTQPLINKAISYYYPIPPGSVFKVLFGLYALEKGYINRFDKYYCRGYMYRRGSFRCTHVHGWVDMEEAIEGSCNVYFYHLGEKVGAKELENCARLFGLGEKSGIGFSGEMKGFIPTPEFKKKRGGSWGKGDSRFFGIGQKIESTPLQIARAMTMVATAGTMPVLRIVKKIKLPPEYYDGNIRKKLHRNRINLVASPKKMRVFRMTYKNWNTIVQGMVKVVYGRHGTATNIRRTLDGLVIASKTGTSQVSRKRDHAWFSGFAPAKNPKYAFAVLIEHGGYGGQSAAPVSAKILKYLLR